MNGSLQKKGKYYYVVLNIRLSDGKFKKQWISTRKEKKKEAAVILREILSRVKKFASLMTKDNHFHQLINLTFMQTINFTIHKKKFLKNVKNNFKMLEI